MIHSMKLEQHLGCFFFIWLGLAIGQMIIPKAQLSQTDKICNTNLVNLQGVCQISGQHEETSLYSLC